MWYFYLFVFCVYSTVATQENNRNWHWTWSCNSQTGKCNRTIYPTENSDILLQSQGYRSVDICRLTCGRYGSLWPIPTGSVALSHQVIPIHPSRISFQYSETTREAAKFLREVSDVFIENLYTDCGSDCSTIPDINIIVFIYYRSSDITLNWHTNESYTLEVFTKGNRVSVQIIAETVFGVRHALETLTQLVASFEIPSSSGNSVAHGIVLISGARISDRPVYTHRGLLIDTARNFMPISTIKRQIDGMAASKMNVLHWHATDSQSFPLVLPSEPNLARFGAYSKDQTYTLDNIRKLIRYALVRGVRIILELDAPSHAGNGWQWGPAAGLGNLAVCINQQPWRKYCIEPPCGQLNPANPNLYEVLANIYHDIFDIFPNSEVLHMGGDEVFIPCWNSSSEIVDYLTLQGKGLDTLSFLDFWAEYQSKALKTLDEQIGHNRTKIMMWTSHLTEPSTIDRFLNKQRYVIQTWVPAADRTPEQLLSKGYQLVISTKDSWYLDHGFWGTTLYRAWRNVYKNRILRNRGVLGGEVCMWSEYVDDAGVDSRIWPRTAAAAERLWADPNTSADVALPRMYQHRERLIRRGISSDVLAPQWCYQNEGDC